MYYVYFSATLAENMAFLEIYLLISYQIPLECWITITIGVYIRLLYSYSILSFFFCFFFFVAEVLFFFVWVIVSNGRVQYYITCHIYQS